MDDFQRRFPRTVAMVESRMAAQNTKESAQHIHQHTHGGSEDSTQIYSPRCPSIMCYNKQLRDKQQCHKCDRVGE